MKYPFLLAALLLCSANLAARHPDTHTLLQPDTLSLRQSDAHTVHGSDSLGMRRPDSLRQSDALSAQKSDAPFVRPPYLRPGDTIGIVTPGAQTQGEGRHGQSPGTLRRVGPESEIRSALRRPRTALLRRDRRPARRRPAGHDRRSRRESRRQLSGRLRIGAPAPAARPHAAARTSQVDRRIQRRHHAPHGAGAAGHRKPSRHDAGQIPFRRRRKTRSDRLGRIVAQRAFSAAGRASTPPHTRSTSPARPADGSRAATSRCSARRSGRPNSPTSTPRRCCSSRRSANRCTGSTA